MLQIPSSVATNVFVRAIAIYVCGFLFFLLMCVMASAQTYNSTSGTTSWNVNGNWTPSGFPNAVGASATFNSPTAARTVNLSAAITVGTINFTNNETVVNTLANGTGGSLILDAPGSGEAAINISGTSTTTNNTTISASTTLNDTLRLTNNNISGTGAATATMTGTVTGAGGFIKDGAGRFSFSTVAKAYTGATVVNRGRLRMTNSGQITGTSSILVNSGGSLYLDSGSGTWSFGSGGAAVITLNGDGDDGGGSGTQGALRNQGSGTNTLANAVALASNATIHVDGSSVLQLNGALSGGFVSLKTGGGTLNLNNANTGITTSHTVSNGSVTVSSASKLGSGALSFAQTAGNNTAVTLSNSTQSISALSSAWVDLTGTLTQTLTLTGTALTIDQASDTTFGVGAVSTLTSVIAGSGSVIKSGVGNLTLTNANTYTGKTTITGGFIAGSGESIFGTNPGGFTADQITLNGGGVKATGNIAFNSNRGITLDSGGGTLDTNGNSINLTNEVTGSGLLTKQGAGTLTLNSANTHSGGVTVTAGTVAVKNTTGSATGSGDVTVTGSTILGTGRVSPASGGSVIFGNAAILSVGDAGDTTGKKLIFTPASGTMSTTFQSGSVFEIDLFTGAGSGDNSGIGTAADALQWGGTLALQSNVKLRVNNPNSMTAWAEGDIWKVLDWTTFGGSSPSGTFAISMLELPTLTGLLGWDTSNLYTAGTLGIIAVPEPSRLVLMLLSVMGLVSRRRRI